MEPITLTPEELAYRGEVLAIFVDCYGVEITNAWLDGNVQQINAYMRQIHENPDNVAGMLVGFLALAKDTDLMGYVIRAKA